MIINKACDFSDLEKDEYKVVINAFENIRQEAEVNNIPYRLDGTEWLNATVKKWEMSQLILNVPLNKGDRVLDAGSQYSLFSVMLAKFGCIVYPVDINPSSQPGNMNLKNGFRLGDNFNPSIEDMRHLSFPDDFFDAAFTLSVIEHIPDDGDIQAVKEIARVVKPGGYIGMTIDFYKEFIRGKDVLDPNIPVLKQRYWWVQERIYDGQAVWDRVIKPSGCEVVGEIDFSYDEKKPAVYNIYSIVSLVLRKPEVK